MSSICPDSVPVAASLSIQSVALRTGLTPHVIRAWERRYGAIAPVRSQGRHRLYSEAEVNTLNLLQRAIEAGHSIGQIAALPNEELRSLTLQPLPANAPPGDEASPFRDEVLRAVRELNPTALRDGLQRGLVSLGHQGMLRQLVAPLAREIGELWRSGELTAAHEHFFTAAVKTFLGNLSRHFIPMKNAPRLVVGTPTGQLHELGAVLVAAEAAHLGWDVVYLGPSLPAAEIAGAATRQNADAIALSLVYPEDDPNLPGELEELASFLPNGIRLLVGGRAAAAYLPTLEKIGATYGGRLEEFSEKLDAVRRKVQG